MSRRRAGPGHPAPSLGPRLVALLAATPLVLPVLVLTALPAAAAAPPPQVGIDAVVLTPGHARLTLTASGLPPGVEADISADVDGVAVPVRFAGPDAAAPPRAVMLLLDTSLSMAGSGIETAREVAADFVRALPSDAQLGLVAFDERPRLLVAPSTDRAPVLAALADATAQGDTALYDAVDMAVSALEAAGIGATAQRRLVVLSDGVDTASTGGLAAARDGLAAGGIAADVVAFRYGQVDTSAVDGLAAAAGGRVLAADDAAQLASALAVVVGRVGQRVTLELDLPAGVAGRSAELAVTIGGATASTAAQVPAAPAPAAAPGPSPPGPPPPATPTSATPTSATPAPSRPAGWQLLALLGTVFTTVLVSVLLLVGAIWPDTPGRRLVKQITRYGPKRETTDGDGKLARRAVGLVTSLLRKLKVDRALAERLDLAAITRSPAEWALLGICVGAVLAAAITVATANALLGFAAGALLGWLGMRFFLSFRIGRRRSAFGEQLPDVLQLVAGSLQSGFSLQQALDAVVRDGTQPAAGETSRALVQTRIGVVLETALDKIADRMNSTDMRWVVMAIRIQREVGGNLAEVLLTTVGTIRERAQTRRQVRSLSAEGRISAYILIALPIGVGGFLFYSSPDYVRPLIATGQGLVMLGAAGVLVVLGALWMRKLVTVEV